jgi:hypothetical protein
MPFLPASQPAFSASGWAKPTIPSGGGRKNNTFKPTLRRMRAARDTECELHRAVAEPEINCTL